MADIFFSYTRADRNRIQPLIAALEERGWTVWWDKKINGGDSWNDVIEAELTKARCVVVAWSELSSKSAWVKEEARAATKAQKLVPVLLDSTEPPFGFGGIQAVDFSSWVKNKKAPEFLSLCKALQGKIGSQSSERPVSEAPAQAVHAIQSPDQGRRWLIVASVAIGAFILLTAGLLLHFHSQKVFINNVQLALCVPDANGVAGASTIAAVRNYLQGMRRNMPASIDLKSAELVPVLQAAVEDVDNCASAGFKNAFEVGYFGVPATKRNARTMEFQHMLSFALKNEGSGAAIMLTGTLDAATRMGIANFRRVSGLANGDEVDFELVKLLLRSVP
ncbi:hypothetical protein V1294_000773 [Bradyrhizobium sp. AZCC 1678]|uniref:toll/interleukin-1 receptor domain-containing protein n=1 Tax=Bradyrhizobium sp. AZCC 1678 TaxID=3117030 RepID=UPI002FF2A379